MTKAATSNPGKTARIEVFRTGTFTPMQGEAITYSAADLAAVADAYDPETAPAPVVIGHPSTDAPAYAWAQSFEWDAPANRLFAVIGDIAPAFAEAVEAKHYKKVSLSFHRPDGAANPVPGTWYPKHIGFLGGAAPAVTGLKNVQFSGTDTEAVTFAAAFGERGFEETASILRMLREFFIERFGLDEADKALPAYRLEWLGETEIAKPVETRPSFTAPSPDPKKEPALTKPDPAFAAREADVAAREERLNARERELAHADNVAFAETLVSEGRVIAASKDKVISILSAIPVETSVSFSAGEAAVPVAKAIRDLLKEQPRVVTFGALDLPETSNTDTASFAADGHTVDRDQLDLHRKAEAYQRTHPGTAYLDAVRAVS